MKLEKLIVRRFRGICHPVTLRFHNNNLIFLSGPNNAGKSTLMEAYDFFVTAKRTADPDDFHKGDASSPIEIEAWFRAESEQDRTHRAFRSCLDENGRARIRKVWTTPGHEGAKQTYHPAAEKWEDGGAGGFDTILQNGCPTPIWIRGMMTPEEAVSGLQALVKETLLKTVRETDAYQQAKRALEALQTEISTLPYTADLEAGLNQLNDRTFPGIRFRLDTEPEPDFVNKLMKDKTRVKVCRSDDADPVELDLDSFGHGVRRQFVLNSCYSLSEQILLSKKKSAKTPDMFAFPASCDAADTPIRKTKILLFEEPELYLHPDVARSIRDLLYELSDRSEFQVLCTTHSPLMVDLAKEHTTLVRVVMNERQETTVHQVESTLFEDDERDRMRMLKSFDPYVCEAFFTDRVLLVEGDTEAVVVRTLAPILGERVHVVNCGSKMNIPLFQKVLRHFGIDYSVFHDLDDKTNSKGQLNAAWTMNERIWHEIVAARQVGVAARRYLFERNFEEAHHYEHSTHDGKPYSAYKMARTLLDHAAAAHAPVLQFLRSVCGQLDLPETFDQDYVEDRGESTGTTA